MDMRMRDMRNPYGSEGGYVSSRRSRRGRRRDRAMMRDRGMDYAYDRRDYRGGDYEYDSRRGDRMYSEQDYERGRRDYESMGQSGMGSGDYRDMRDMHYGEREGNFRPVEAMGYFTGYYGGGQDYARGRGRDYGDYNYDMRGRGGRDYGYGDYGDYGESLTREELEEWKKKLMKEVDEKDKAFFETQNIEQKARQVGAEMKDYKPEELAVATAMAYTDYCKTLKRYIGNTMDVYVELGKDWLEDKDSAVKGSEKLALYHDEIIMADED